MKTRYAMALAIIGAAFVAATVYAQSVDYTIRQVRDPVQLRDKINTDMGAIESRVALMEGVTNGGALAAAKILVGNAAGVAAAQTISGSGTLNTSGVFTVTGLTTNLSVLVAGGTTNILQFTNGVLRVIQ